MEKPLFYFGGCYLWTLMIIAFTGTPMAVALLAAAVLTSVGLLILLRRSSQDREKLRFFLAAACVVAVACAAFLLQLKLVYEPALSHAGEEVEGTYLVTEVQNDSSGGAHRCVVRVLKGGPVRHLRVSSSTYRPTVGDVFSARMKLSVLGEQDREVRLYYRSRGLYLGATTNDRITTEPLSERAARGELDLSPPVRLFWNAVLSIAALRDRMTGSVSDWLPAEYAAVLNAMLVGDKTELASETNTVFKKAGILHLFAVSGFHTSLWTMLFYKLLLRMGAGRKSAAGGAILFLAGFVLLTGLSRSAVRAGVMLGVFFLGRIVLRTSEALNALGAAVLAVVLPNPFYGGDTGLLLSYFATLGILSLYPPVMKPVRERLKERIPNYKLRKRVESVLAVLLITLCTFVSTLPVVTLSLGNVSLAAFPANLLASAASSAAILLTGLGALFAQLPVLSLLTPWCYLGSGWIARYLLTVCETLAGLPLSYVSLGGRGFGLGLAAALLTATAGFVLYGSLREQGLVRVTALLSVIVLLGSVLAEAALGNGIVKVTFADVEGTCLVVTYRHAAAVIGCGGNAYGTTHALDEIFQREGVTQCAAVVVPRDKGTEAGALKEVLEAHPPNVLVRPQDLAGTVERTVRLAPEISLILYAQNGDFCAGLLEAEGVRFLLLFRPTVDLSALPPEALAAPVRFVRGNVPEGLKSGPSSYIIVSGETGEVEARVRDGRFRLYRYRDAE